MHRHGAMGHDDKFKLYGWVGTIPDKPYLLNTWNIYPKHDYKAGLNNHYLNPVCPGFLKTSCDGRNIAMTACVNYLTLSCLSDTTSQLTADGFLEPGFNTLVFRCRKFYFHKIEN